MGSIVKVPTEADPLGETISVHRLSRGALWRAALGSLVVLAFASVLVLLPWLPGGDSAANGPSWLQVLLLGALAPGLLVLVLAGLVAVLRQRNHVIRTAGTDQGGRRANSLCWMLHVAAPRANT